MPDWRYCICINVRVYVCRCLTKQWEPCYCHRQPTRRRRSARWSNCSLFSSVFARALRLEHINLQAKPASAFSSIVALSHNTPLLSHNAPVLSHFVVCTAMTVAFSNRHHVECVWYIVLYYNSFMVHCAELLHYHIECVWWYCVATLNEYGNHIKCVWYTVLYHNIEWVWYIVLTVYGTWYCIIFTFNVWYIVFYHHFDCIYTVKVYHSTWYCIIFTCMVHCIVSARSYDDSCLLLAHLQLLCVGMHHWKE